MVSWYSSVKELEFLGEVLHTGWAWNAGKVNKQMRERERRDGAMLKSIPEPSLKVWTMVKSGTVWAAQYIATVLGYNKQ